jgi:hypothetical protein
MDVGLTTSQLLAAVSELLETGRYAPVSPGEGWGSNTRLFEDPYGIVAVVAFETWGDLAREWPDAQGRLVELISEHLTRPEPKSWDGYLVLLTPGLVPSTARSQLAEIRYDTNRLRKLVATGDELRTLDDVEQVLLPLLPLEVESQVESGPALLERLPALLAERGIDAGAARVAVDAFTSNQSILERLHELRSIE